MNFFLFLFGMFSFQLVLCQEDYPTEYGVVFDPGFNENNMQYIQDITGIWQIGKPQKSHFVVADGINMVTDTLQHYPVNDTSSFTIRHVPDYGASVDYFVISGAFKIDCDSAKDYGKIEFSPNNGVSWILISEDTIGGWPWDISYDNTVGLTGLSSDWTGFFIDLVGIELHAPFNSGDTTLFRFTFISDSIPESRDGWMDVKPHCY